MDLLFDPNNPLMWILIIAIVGGALASIIRPFITFAKFTYPNAKFESIGNPFVKETNLHRFLELSDLQQFTDQLNNQKDYQIDSEQASDIQTALDHHYVSTIQMMKQDSTKKMKHFYETYQELLDVNLIKTAFKQYQSNQEIDEDLSTHAISERIQKQLHILSKTEPEKIDTVLKKFGYPETIQHLILSKVEFSSFALDATIDAMLLEKLKRTKVPYKCEQAKDIFLKRMIDIRTIKHILRAKHLGYDADHCEQLLIDEGYELALWKQKDLCKTENIKEVISKLDGTSYYQALKSILDAEKEQSSIQLFTDALDKNWLYVLKNISTTYYTTIGPSLRFLEYKQMEIRNLKIITKGIAEQLPSKFIAPLLITEDA